MKTPSKAQRLLDSRNRWAEKVERLEDQLYEARQSLREIENQAFQALPDGYQIRMPRSGPYELVGPEPAH